MAEKEQKPIIIAASIDHILSTNLGRLITECGFRCIRTNKLERIIKELKYPGRVAIIDMNWKEAQAVGVLRQLVNIAAITENKVIAICPNKDEDLKKLAKQSRASEVFIRYDLETGFKDYIKML